MKKLYYVIEKELNDIDGFEETTGWKTIDVYTIENNKPKKWFDLNIPNCENSEESILTWLDDNGFGDETIKLTIL